MEKFLDLGYFVISTVTLLFNGEMVETSSNNTPVDTTKQPTLGDILSEGRESLQQPTWSFYFKITCWMYSNYFLLYLRLLLSLRSVLLVF